MRNHNHIEIYPFCLTNTRSIIIEMITIQMRQIEKGARFVWTPSCLHHLAAGLRWVN
jgi:hypothetical protein